MNKTIIIAMLYATSSMAVCAQDRQAYTSFSTGQSSYSDSFFQNSTSFELSYGQEISDHFYGEVGLISFGEAEYDIGFGEFGTLETVGVNLSFVGSFPVSDKLSLYAKLGYLTWASTIETDNISEDIDGSDISYGFGTQYNATESVSIFTEYRAFALDSATLYNYNVGMAIRF